MYFNIEINILDSYSFKCEKVHMLVFINYWNEKCTVKHWKSEDTILHGQKSRQNNKQKAILVISLVFGLSFLTLCIKIY